MTTDTTASFLSKFDELGVKAMIRLFLQDEDRFCIAVYDREYSDAHPIFTFTTNSYSFKRIISLTANGEYLIIPGLNRKEIENAILTGEYPLWSGKL